MTIGPLVVVFPREKIMEFRNIEENADGSAQCVVDMSSEEVSMLLEYAIVHLIKEHVLSEEHLKDGSKP